MAQIKSNFSLVIGPEWRSELNKLNATEKEIKIAVRDELITTAVNIRNHIIRNMSKSKTGRLYRKTKNKNIFHKASAPWEAPARDTGALVRSIKMDVRTSEVEVGSNMKGKEGKYPVFLEFGTSKMEARPYLRPAFDDSKRLFYATVRKNVTNAIKRAR